MRTVLLIGATGVFGRRLAAHLSAFEGVRLVVTSRAAERAEELAASLNARAGSRGAVGAALDTRGDLPAQLAALSPWVVVDTSGPFQGADYRVPAAALAAGAHYIDLADARQYLAGFGHALDGPARAKGLVALAGASSTPALSSAVVRAVTDGWSVIETIDIAITPGGRSDVGPAVVAAILSYAGDPVPVFRGGKLVMEAAWVSSSPVAIRGLGRRNVALVETCDAEALSARFGVRDRVTFRAGLESSIEQLGLGLLARVRRRGWLRDPRSLVSPLLVARRLTRLVTGDRGGMIVAIAGADREGRPIQATWTLLATDGDGPHVPTLPAAAAVRALLSGNVLEPGARACVGDLPLASIEREMAPYRITTAVSLADGGDLGSGGFG